MFKAYLSFLLCLAGFASLAEAATPCVSTAGDLQNELAIWSTMSSGDMTIRLVQGTYALTLQNYYDATGKATLSILGGYTANCTGRFV
ncbi:MAG TPA: hypothetical protein VH082_03990, partial [Rudaea sp.]|nr:hypothetical protein [Rudaea sp.]